MLQTYNVKKAALLKNLAGVPLTTKLENRFFEGVYDTLVI
jgi:hypothetical protein